MKHWDLMIGIDRHIPWPPPEPVPLPDPVPYVTTMILMGLQPLTPMMAKTSMTLYGWTMQRGTDIGPGIPHVGMLSLLTPLDILFSSSVSYFGPSNYLHEAEPCAAALVVVVNTNANCQEPVSLPTGLVFCITTHFTNMTFLDVVFGFACMGFDMVLEFASGQLSNFAGKAVKKYVTGPIGKKIAAKTASKAAMKSTTGAGAGAAAKNGPTIGAHRLSAPAPGGKFTPSSPSGPRPADGPQLGGHRPAAAKPDVPSDSFKPARPSGPRPPDPPQAGGHRPNTFRPARPSGPRPPDAPRPGGHRQRPPGWKPGSPEPGWRPAKPSAQQPPKQKKPSRARVIKDIGLDILLDLGMEAPASFVHMGGMEVLAITGIEEFGATPEDQED